MLFRALKEFGRDIPSHRSGEVRVTSLPTTTVVASETAPILNTESIHQLDPLAPLEAHPDLESLDQFRERCLKHWDARIADAINSGEFVPVAKMTERHIDWLVRFQVLNENYSQIARIVGPNVKWQTIREGIRAAAAIIGLQIRDAPRGAPRG